jgi:predicted dehydrogenase
MIRVGLIGAGFMGRNHFNQYEKMAGRAAVVALCDKEADRRAGDWSKVGGNLADAQGTKRNLGGVRPYTRWQDLVADTSVDMIDVCVPTFVHREIALAGLEAGKHVLCEKPMALTVQECDTMLAAARRARGKFMIAQCVRFGPEYVYLQRVHAEQRFGSLRALHLRRQASTPDYCLDNWVLDPALSGGAILDLHVHDVDYALWLLGKPRSVCAQGYESASGGVGRVHATWHYDTGQVVQLEGFWDVPPGLPFNMGFTAIFEEAALVWDLNTGRPLTLYRAGCAPAVPELPTQDAYFAEIDYFLGCIERGQDPKISTPQESRDAVAIAIAEKQSVLTGKPVTIT